MKLQLCVVALALGLASQTVFGALVITEVVSNPGTPDDLILDTLDWWELTNTGPSSVSLNGFEWEDDPVEGATAVFPNAISVASGESIIILRDRGRDPNDVESAFRTEWGLSPAVQVLTESLFTGTNTFSGLGSSGDAVFLFDGPPLGAGSLISSVDFGQATPGISFEWKTSGASLGLSVVGENGATSASNGRVGSPGIALFSGAPQTVFKDTFELVDFSTQPDVNAELPGPRQIGSLSTYSPGATPATAGVLIEDDPFGAGSGDWLTLRTAGPVDPDNFSIAQANLDFDFGPQLAGNKYSVSYTSRIDDTGTDPNAGAWQALSLGDTAPTSVDGGSTDLGLLLNPSGGWQAFLDGTMVANQTTTGIDTGIRLGQFFDVQIDIDETVASPTATATITATLGPVVLGTLPLDALGSGFDSAGRLFQLQTFLDAAGGGGLDHRFDNLAINLVPEPTTGLMFSLVCFVCAVGRRATR